MHPPWAGSGPPIKNRQFTQSTTQRVYGSIKWKPYSVTEVPSNKPKFIMSHSNLQISYSNMNYFKCVFLVMFWLSTNALANEAAQCIQLDDDLKKESRSFKNTCSRDVIVFWCHADVGPGARSSACDPAKRLYRQNRVLKAEEVTTNRFSQPLGAEIQYGACFGSYFSFELLDGEGNYICKPEGTKSESGKSRLVHTAGRPSEDDACKAASELARGSGNLSQCVCEQRGQINICRVESDFKSGGSESMLESAKTQLRKYTSCKSENRTDCVFPKTVSIGRRG